MDIRKKIKNVPDSAGVYIFLGKNEKALYVGKAANLRKRIASYFRKTYQPPKTRALVSQIKDLDYIETPSSAEALIYEARLIKEKRPKYNIELKDDKSYPFLKLTLNEKFPRLVITREKHKGNAVYYGPYTNVKLLRKALATIRGIFRIRSCDNLPKKPCLKAHIKTCVAPCDGSIGEKEYKDIIGEVKLFLEGKREGLAKELSRKMSVSSGSLDYEKALVLRDKIEALSAMWKGRKPPPPLNREIKELKKVLGLTATPSRIEAFDISDICGKEAVGSMVSFFCGRPRKDEYRRFRIKTVEGINDYGMIKEVIRRRYSRLLREGARFPDLILIDGGKGHLNTARDELDKLGPVKIPLASIAKKKEYVYTEGRKGPVKLTKRSPALRLIMRIRDEAHRFAVSYHKLLRKKAFIGRGPVHAKEAKKTIRRVRKK